MMQEHSLKPDHVWMRNEVLEEVETAIKKHTPEFDLDGPSFSEQVAHLEGYRRALDVIRTMKGETDD